jgi:hypothetical protein
MEVHHHPHVEKKSFKEYLLEYIMIVLAVTTGFFAEGLREHLGDREKEETYVKSLKEDLIIDTTNMAGSIYLQGKQIEAFDSLRLLLNKTVLDTAEVNTAYYYARIATRKKNFRPNDKTLVQLKSSGNFRLIRTQALIDKLLDYQMKYESYDYNSGFDKSEAEQIYTFIPKLFDPNVFETMVKNNITNGPANVERPTGVNYIKKTDKEVIHAFEYYLHTRKTSFRAELQLLKDMRNIANEMISIINKEYHLEKE